MHARSTRTWTRAGSDLRYAAPERALALAVAALLVGCPSPGQRPDRGPDPGTDRGPQAGAAGSAAQGQAGAPQAQAGSAARPGADPLPVGLPPVGWAAGQTAAGGGRWAVLVIADEFAAGGPSWKLQRAPEVLQRLQATLPGALGIAAERTVVLRGKDVNPEAIEDALRDVGGKLAGPENLVLVYYYGHGYTRRARDARGQELKSLELFMHRTRSLEGDAFDRTLGHRDLGRCYAELRAAARKRGATARIVSVVDACRVELQAPGGPVTLTPLDDVVELFSASPGQFAEEGLFARAFCEALAAGAQADATKLDEVVRDTAARIERAQGSQRPELLQGDRSLVLRRADDLVLGVEVTDATRPGKPVEGARVTLAGRPAADASAGPARFDGLRPGQYAWQVEAPGYFWRTGEQEVSRAHAGGVLRVALLPRAALVEGELVNPDGTVVTVKVLGGRSPAFLEGYHVDQARVVGSGPFALRLPEVGDDTELSLTLGDRPLLRVRPAKAPAEPVVWGELRVPRHGLGKLDLTGRAAAGRVEDLGTSLSAAQVRLPELAFAETVAGRECGVRYQQVRAQVNRDTAEQLELAADELEALRAHVAPASRGELARLAAELRLEVLVRRRAREPLPAREALCALLGAGPGFTPRPGVRPAPAAALAEHPGTLDRARGEAVRWLSSDADAAGQRRDWAGKTALLAQALALASEPRVVAVLEAQHTDAWAQRVDAALARALEDDGWAAAQQELARARQALGARAEAALGALALRFEQERMPRAARALVQRGHDAYAAGRLEEAAARYEEALPDCNAHTATIVERQLADVRFRLFRRHYVLADEALADGRRPEAARAVLEAQRYGSADSVAGLARRLTEADWRACAPAWALARSPLPAPWTFLLAEAEATAAPAWVLTEPRRPPAWAWKLRERPAAWVLGRASAPPAWSHGLAQEPAAWALEERTAPPGWALGLASRPPTWAFGRSAAPPGWALALATEPPAWALRRPQAPPAWALARGDEPPAWALRRSAAPPEWALALSSEPPGWALGRTASPPAWALSEAQEPPAWALRRPTAPPAWALRHAQEPPAWALGRTTAPPAWALTRPSAPPEWTLGLPEAPPEWAFAHRSEQEYRAELARRPKHPPGFRQGEREHELIHEKTGMVFVRVRAGSFDMGYAGTDAFAWEKPVHRVTLTKDYLIGKFEVTWAQYRAFCQATGRSSPSNEISYNGTFRAGDDHPVFRVDWNDAKAYCDWAGLRLPTEAEWEYAARGSDGRAWPWGNDAPGRTRCNLGTYDAERNSSASDYRDASDGFPWTAPVGSFPQGVSPFGAHDMAGNVWEWVADWYADYGPGAQTDPSGPASGTSRARRGGSWNYGARHCRASSRYWSPPDLRSRGLGFRAAFSPQ